jgi:phosphoribosyl 1,2-cyclic phosphodiesterase
MARFSPLFSGSKGNCTYIGCSGGGILIDAGVSAKAITRALSDNGVSTDEIKAVFVTHEHSDHVSGLRVFVSRNHIPVYASETTLCSLADTCKINSSVDAHPISGAISVAGMSITRFNTLHDCAGSSGYIIETPDDRKIAVCTDLGCITDEVRTAISGCDLVMLESNHDVMMLQNGPYPYELKRRILSDHGHLSNAVCADELPRLVSTGTTRLILAHLSQENNHPALAETTAKSALDLCGMKSDIDYVLSVAPPSGGKTVIL